MRGQRPFWSPATVAAAALAFGVALGAAALAQDEHPPKDEATPTRAVLDGAGGIDRGGTYSHSGEVDSADLDTPAVRGRNYQMACAVTVGRRPDRCLIDADVVGAACHCNGHENGRPFTVHGYTVGE